MAWLDGFRFVEMRYRLGEGDERVVAWSPYCQFDVGRPFVNSVIDAAQKSLCRVWLVGV